VYTTGCHIKEAETNSKQQTANSKQQTANSKQQTANSTQHTAHSTQHTAHSIIIIYIQYRLGFMNYFDLIYAFVILLFTQRCNLPAFDY
jgi:hypothetical protein